MIAIDVKRIPDFVAGGEMVEVDIVFQRRHVSSPLSPAEGRVLLHGESTFAVRLLEAGRGAKYGMR